jgi:2,5-diamino-6-(ribosylamino)-4(3H)-pyrimidinone 5'-phosphate reductase
MEELYVEAPIRPYMQGDQPAFVSPADLLTLDNSSISKLDDYLPPERTTFLREGPIYNHGRRDEDDIGYPHVTLTYAQSLDGQIALQPGIQTLLSGRETKAMTHYLRTKHDAILVGVGTANADDPGLNSRYSHDGRTMVNFGRQPRPFILDPGKSWKVDTCDKVFDLAKKGLGRAPWWITSENVYVNEETGKDQACLNKIWGVGGNHMTAGIYEGKRNGVDWEEILQALWRTGIRSVMIEGGATVINDLLREKNQHFISSVIVTIAPIYLGSGGVVVAPPRTYPQKTEVVLPRQNVSWLPFGKDIVMACHFAGRE